MSLLVIAYPILSSQDFDLIQEFRKEHDEFHHSIVLPHFTLIFPVEGVEEKVFMDEIEKQTSDFMKFEFAIQCAMINKDAFTDNYHIFLVPDEGFSHFVKLHDKLYSGLLSTHLRLDIDFIPHIGIGISKDKFVCKSWVDLWNKDTFSITGGVSAISIVRFENNLVTRLKEIILT
jgi:2'-5' RNA ligase